MKLFNSRYSQSAQSWRPAFVDFSQNRRAPYKYTLADKMSEHDIQGTWIIQCIVIAVTWLQSSNHNAILQIHQSVWTKRVIYFNLHTMDNNVIKATCLTAK